MKSNSTPEKIEQILSSITGSGSLSIFEKIIAREVIDEIIAEIYNDPDKFAIKIPITIIHQYARKLFNGDPGNFDYENMIMYLKAHNFPVDEKDLWLIDKAFGYEILSRTVSKLKKLASRKPIGQAEFEEFKSLATDKFDKLEGWNTIKDAALNEVISGYRLLLDRIELLENKIDGKEWKPQ